MDLQPGAPEYGAWRYHSAALAEDSSNIGYGQNAKTIGRQVSSLGGNQAGFYSQKHEYLPLRRGEHVVELRSHENNQINSRSRHKWRVAIFQ